MAASLAQVGTVASQRSSEWDEPPVDHPRVDDPRVAATLTRVFGHTVLRPSQTEAIAAILAGRDVLVVMPTGGGKSLCYQLPAVLDAPPALTLVVSPLIALMQDQVNALRARGVAAGALHSLQTSPEAAAVIHASARGQLRLLYVSPERLAGSSSLRAGLARAGVRRVVVDEAHCVVRWGPDFRPSYLEIGKVLAEIGEPQLVAMTATATPTDQREILRALGRPRARRLVAGFDRPEIYYAVRHTPTRGAKAASLARVVDRCEGPALVYVGTRSEADTVARWLVQKRRAPAAAYHAGLPAASRAAAQHAFMADRLRVVVATTAFGMGVDKPDVRAVVHWTLPGDLTEYLQATGRAGRDGGPAIALLLYSPEDRRLREWQIAGDAPGSAELGATYIAVETRMAYASTADEPAITASAGLSRAQVRGALIWLQRAGVVRPAGASVDAWTVVRPPQAGEIAGLAAAAAARRVERRRALEQVIAYSTGGHCRRWALLAHVGEARPEPRALCCDICRAGSGDGRDWAPDEPCWRSRPTTEDAGRAPPGVPDLDSRVLGAIRTREGHATVRTLAKLLSAGGDGCDVPGVRPRIADIAAAVGRLLEARLVVAHHGAEPARLALTRRGRERVESDGLTRPGTDSILNKGA